MHGGSAVVRTIVYLHALMLQRNKMVRKGKDVRPLLTRRIDMSEAGKLSMLLQEAHAAKRQTVISQSESNDSRTVVQDVQPFDT